MHDVHNGDCRKVMATLEAESVDAIVSDPPYGLSFMGKGWDHGVPGVEFWTEAFRVAKPGAYLLAFGGTRTYHRLACAIEDAGWEIRDCVMWVYGSGFPKSHDVSKAIDKAAGVERPVIGQWKPTGTARIKGNGNSGHGYEHGELQDTLPITAPATDAARQWAGWGTALKPAWEPIIVARKPLVGTVAENVLAHGTGALNIDGCRVEGVPPSVPQPSFNSPTGKIYGMKTGEGRNGEMSHATCRWPANLIHDGSDEVVRLFPVTTSGAIKAGQPAGRDMRAGCEDHNRIGGRPVHPQDVSGSTGSAARFFYCAKASKRDRYEGCEGLSVKQSVGGGGGVGDYLVDVDSASGKFGSEKAPAKNFHPTVKPTDLMRYLCRLVTPPGGTVLDPFCGSGSTGKAAILEGFQFVGIEREDEYVAIAKARCSAAEMERSGESGKCYKRLHSGDDIAGDLVTNHGNSSNIRTKLENKPSLCRRQSNKKLHHPQMVQLTFDY
jgi:site-specific DNA-methyltransferase (adenine-specific)